MDESLQELENELRRLPPQRLSAGLIRRLEAELGAAPAARVPAAPERHSWKWTVGAMAAALLVAATILVMMDQLDAMLPTRPASAPIAATSAAPATPAAASAASPAGQRYEPVRASSVLYGLQDDGAATLSDSTAGRRVRYRYVDTYTWKNPTTKASLQWSIPRDEVRLVRANLD